MLKDDDLLQQVEVDYEAAAASGGLSPARLAMLRYAEKLTLRPQDVVVADVENLRDVGWSDRDILEIAEVTAYYAYVNRIADGLGVELEDPPP